MLVFKFYDNYLSFRRVLALGERDLFKKFVFVLFKIEVFDNKA